jgi:hypothetical protein
MGRMHACFVVVLFVCGSIVAQAPQKLVLHFFGSRTCGECAKIKTTLLLPLAERNRDKLDLHIHEIPVSSSR